MDLYLLFNFNFTLYNTIPTLKGLEWDVLFKNCGLDLTWIDLKINRDHLHTEVNVSAKFGDPSSILCQVIIRTRFGIPTDRPT